MANINLSQSSVERKKHELGSVFDKSLVISIGLLTLAFGTLFGLKLYNSIIEKRTATLNDEIAVQLAALEGASVNRLADFQERLNVIDKKLSSKDVTAQDMFSSVESLMVSGVSLDSYKYDATAKTLSMKVVSNDFKSAAQQIMSFKSNGVFKGVTVGSSSRGDSGGVVSDVVISL